MATERPNTEWIYDDLGNMKFAAVDDFTSANFGRHVGVVLSFTEKDGSRGKFQFSMEPDLARALFDALAGHV